MVVLARLTNENADLAVSEAERARLQGELDRLKATEQARLQSEAELCQ